MTETIEDAEFIEQDEHGNEIAVREVSPATLFGTNSPTLVLERATEVANALAQVIQQKKLYTVMGRDKEGNERRHIKVEAWMMLGAMIGVFPETEWTRKIEDSNGNLAYEARVVARTRDGAIVGAREAMCSKSEPNWKTRDDYAIRSMAQTRATSGALSMPLRFIVVLAGFEGTPAEEMPTGEQREERRVEKPEQKLPRTGAEIGQALVELLGKDDAPVWVQQAREAFTTLGKSPTLNQRLARAIGIMLEQTPKSSLDGGWDTAGRADIQAVFATCFDGIQFPGPAWSLSGDEEGRPTRDEVLGAEPKEEK